MTLQESSLHSLLFELEQLERNGQLPWQLESAYADYLEANKHCECPACKGKTIQALLNSPSDPQVQEQDHDFKNFHRSLCQRFGYTHDEKDWKRDLVSLEEWIAKQVTKPKVQEPIPTEVSTEGDAAIDAMLKE